jgi:TonB family protein
MNYRALATFFIAAMLTASATENGSEIKLTSYATPEFPPLAWIANVSGKVTLDLTVNSDGGVESSKVLSGHPLLQKAALDNSMTWKFAAANGRSLGGEHLTVTYEFQMEGESQCGKGPVHVAFKSFDHVQIVTNPVSLCDPTFTVGRKHRHWYWPW